MKKIVYMLILAMAITSCSKGKPFGTVNGKTVTSNEFFDMLVNEYGFIKNRKIPENRLQGIFNDYYTYYALAKDGEKNNFFSNEKIKKRIEEGKVRMVKNDLSSVLWLKDIKPKVIPVSTQTLQDKDYEPYQNKAKARYILFSKNRTKQYIETVLNKVRSAVASRVPFENMVKQYSDDPKSKANGGLLDWFDMSYTGLNAEIKKAILFSGVPGFLIGPVETNEGTYLVFILDKKNRTLEEVKNDGKITEYLNQQLKTPICKRKDSKDVSKTYMTKLRKKYADKIHFYPEKLKEYFVGLNSYCQSSHRAIYNEFTDSSYGKEGKNAVEKMIQLQKYLEKNYPSLLEDYNMKQGKMVFLQVDGASTMTVDEAIKAMQGQVAQFIENREELKENVRKRFIDYDLRYLECVSKGYEKDEKFIKKYKYNEIEVKGKLYKEELVRIYRKDLETKITDQMAQEYYNKHMAKFNSKPFASVKNFVKSKMVQKKVKHYEKKMIKELLKKYNITLQQK